MANNRRRLVGRVTSNKMDKTVVVTLDLRKKHPIYGKVVTSTKKLMAHDESNSIPMGAIVRVVESKPLSKRKRWVVEEVITAKGIEVIGVLPDEIAVLSSSEAEVMAIDAAANEAVADTASTADANTPDSDTSAASTDDAAQENEVQS